MAIIKCKMCGGDIELTTDKTFGSCEFCGSTMTLPKIDDDQRAAAFNRGNHFRRIGEFDKALAVYERIVREDDTDAEAHWCCALCRFGIEYVEDPTTYEYLPTCHRASFDSFLEDVDYLAAVEHSEGITKRQYQKDGAKIAEVQRSILATSQNAEPYDVFICYKESDTNGDRTRDSLLAQDIYYQLTEQGRKVFFARITLEDVAGTQYEPYIFAALNSAKVMIVVGTKAEHLNAVWVKNEWSRFLAMMKKNRHKLLLPCYRDMDPYDMPEALSVLQSYDMSKIGFIQDLTRGIAKVLDADKKPEPVKETVVVQQTAVPAVNTTSLLKRAFMFLEDGDWNSANEYCEKVLDIEPENAQAYLGKLMAELHVNKQNDLQNQAEPFDGHSNYLKTLRFADDSLKGTLSGYVEHIRNRNEHNRLEGIYNKATGQERTARTEEEYKAAAVTFGMITEYRDSEERRLKCLDLAESARKDAIYEKAKKLLDARVIPDIERAIGIFESVSGWKDADAKVIECRQKIERIKQEDEEQRIQEAKEKKIRSKKTIICSSIATGILAMLVLLFTVIIPTIKYNKADSLLVAGEYEAAMEHFRELNFKDSYEKYCEAFAGLKNNYKERAESCYDNGDYIHAAINYTKAGMPIYAKKVFDFGSILKAGPYKTAGIAADGHVYYQSNDENDRLKESEVQGMTQIFSNINGFTGLDTKGRIVSYATTTDRLYGWYGDSVSTVQEWVGVVDFVDNMRNFYALMSDGTIKSYIGNEEDMYVGMESWENIVSIQEVYGALVGFDNTGRIVIAYENGTKNNEKYSVDSWENIQKVCGTYGILVGIKSDNTLVVAYTPKTNDRINATFLGYTDVVDIVYSIPYMAVLHKDGSVSMELVVSLTSVEKRNQYYQAVVNEIEMWDGIVALHHGAGGYLGIRYDGTIKYVSDDIEYKSSITEYTYNQNSDLKSELESWTDIIWIDSAIDSRFDIDWKYAVGLKSDGTVCSTGNGTYYTAEKNSYTGGYRGVSHSNGNYNNVFSWKLW